MLWLLDVHTYVVARILQVVVKALRCGLFRVIGGCKEISGEFWFVHSL